MNDKSQRGATLHGVLKLDADIERVFGYVQSGVMVWSPDKVVYANPAVCSVFDLSHCDLEGMPWDNLLSGKYRAKVSAWWRAVQQGTVERLMLDVQLAPPRVPEHWFSATFVPARWRGEDAIAVFLSDISGKRKSQEFEQKLVQIQKMEALGRLAGGVAHDMNNTLGAIMGFASVLQCDLAPDSRSYDDVEQILKACHKGRTLMLNLLGFARQGKYRKEAFSVATVVAETADLLRSSVSRSIEITTRITAPGVRVVGDATQIHHAVMNLCLNAIDAMDGGGTLTLRVRTERVDDVTALPHELEEGDYVRIDVEDTGRGMDAAVMERVFEPFFTTKPVGEGTGLGLPMVYGTVKNHGGAVLLESAPGKGTTATILLPLSAQDLRQVASIERRTPSSVDAPVILVVDDEELVRTAMRRMLEKQGYKVLEAPDGREALRIFSAEKERLVAVFLDLMMPVMDGKEAFMRMRAVSDSVPIVVTSGYSQEDKAADLRAMGVDGFVQKPFDLRTIRQVLQELQPADDARTQSR